MVEDPAELALAIRQVTLAVQRYRLRAARAGFDVGASEMMALSQLFTAGPCSPTELAAFLSMTTASVTSLLDRLQRAGHVVRRQHPSDRRKVVVELTPRARETMVAMFALTGAATAHAARALNPSELHLVLRFLCDLTEAYDQIDPVAGLPADFVEHGDASTGQPNEAIATTSTRPSGSIGPPAKRLRACAGTSTPQAASAVAAEGRL